jgi:hypothetical protein
MIRMKINIIRNNKKLRLRTQRESTLVSISQRNTTSFMIKIEGKILPLGEDINMEGDTDNMVIISKSREKTGRLKRAKISRSKMLKPLDKQALQRQNSH